MAHMKHENYGCAGAGNVVMRESQDFRTKALDRETPLSSIHDAAQKIKQES